VTNEDNAQIPVGDSWLYIGGGQTSAGAYTLNIEAGRVPSSGQLVLRTLPNGMQGSAEGYCLSSTSTLLWTNGGSAGGPSSGGNSGTYCQTTTGPCSGAVIPPDTRNWNSFGAGALAVSRVYHACTVSGPFVFVAGGWGDGTNAPIAKTESTFCCQ